MEKQAFHHTKEDTPQGEIISPTLANIALDELEMAIQKFSQKGDKINFVKYADDSVVTAASKEILEDTVQPTIVTFPRPS